MCLLVFKDAGRAFAEASKKKSMFKTAQSLVAAAILAAVAVFAITEKMLLVPWVFALVLAVGILGGYIIGIIMNTLGFKGAFFEGLTAISYALLPLSAGALIAALLSLLPALGVAFGAIAVIVMFSLGFSVLYRGIKEMFRCDMLTSFVAVSILTLAFIIGLYTTLGLNTLAAARILGV